MQARTFIPPTPRPTSWLDHARAILPLGFDWRRALVKHLSPAPTDDIVDLGLGVDAALPALITAEAPHARVAAVAESPQAIARARAKLGGGAHRVRFVQADPVKAALALGDAMPNRVFIATALRTATTPLRNLTDAALTLLRPGGRLDVIAPAAERGLEDQLHAAGFVGLDPQALLPSPGGLITVLSARRPNL